MKKLFISWRLRVGVIGSVLGFWGSCLGLMSGVFILAGCAISGDLPEGVQKTDTVEAVQGQRSDAEAMAKMKAKDVSRVLSEIKFDKSKCRAPLVVAHRGASGYYPEHTLRAYSRALDMGADFIEPDLVITKDGVLIARHENEISQTTDVEDKFANRKTTKIIDGESITGYFAEDFTLAEIKSLRAKERLGHRSHAEDMLHDVPTFEEILVFVTLQEKKRNRHIGLVPELKHSTYFKSIKKPLEPSFVHLLKKYSMHKREEVTRASGLGAMPRILVQSFEVQNLKELKAQLDLDYVQLLDEPQMKPQDGGTTGTYAQMATPEGFKAIKEYATWVAPFKNYIVHLNEGGEIVGVSNFIQNAQAAGLKVMPYTFRSDVQMLPKAYRGDASLEYQLFYRLGVDGLFTDFADHAVSARDAFLKSCQ